MKPKLELLVSFAVVAGCGSADPVLDGEWRQLDRVNNSLIAKIVINPDKTIKFERYKADGSLDDRLSGSFALTGTTTVTTERSEINTTNPTIRVTNSIYFSKNRLVSPALYPQGAHQGVVGTWTTSLRTEQLNATGGTATDNMYTNTVEIKGDSTVRSTISFPTAPAQTQLGSYVMQPNDTYAVTYSSPTGDTDTFTLIDDQVLARDFFQR